MAGQIHRQKKTSGFVILDVHCLQDPALKWDAKGLHSYLMHLPDDWQINMADLQNRGADGRNATTSPMNALIAAGYVLRRRIIGADGRFDGYDYDVFERPQMISVNGFTESGFSAYGKSENGKPATTKNEVKQGLKESKDERDKSRETALPLSAGPSESENSHSEPKEKKAPLIAPTPPFSQAPPPPDLPAPAGPLVAVVFAPPTVEHIPTPDGPSFRVETHPPAEVKTIRQTRQKPTLQKKTVEIPATHAEISPLLNELLEKRPYLQKSPDALRREMEWFFSKPVAFCREHIQCSLDRSSGVWDSLKFSGVEETFLRWQRTQERIATPAQQAGPARPSYGPPPTPQRLEPSTVNKKYRSIRDL